MKQYTKISDSDFLADVSMEVARARAKFQNQPTNVSIMALMEEVGELAQAYLQGNRSGNYQQECIQVACMALRCAVECDL